MIKLLRQLKLVKNHMKSNCFVMLYDLKFGYWYRCYFGSGNDQICYTVNLLFCEMKPWLYGTKSQDNCETPILKSSITMFEEIVDILQLIYYATCYGSLLTLSQHSQMEGSIQQDHHLLPPQSPSVLGLATLLNHWAESGNQVCHPAVTGGNTPWILFRRQYW